MADLYHWFSCDLVAGANGDLLTADNQIVAGAPQGASSLLTQQLLLRRLLTNARDYVWHQKYGAGLPQRVGQLLDIPGLTAVINTQLNLEAGVTHIPEPIVQVAPIPGGAFVHVLYNDAITGGPATLSFNVLQ
jgi:hypothetical protein